ncbi:MAG: hypothetical protein NTX61_18215 [Bacteroidetes bacterium]|nr:hypothetical protein [Bacteroidota bacterium]
MNKKINNVEYSADIYENNKIKNEGCVCLINTRVIRASGLNWKEIEIFGIMFVVGESS